MEPGFDRHRIVSEIDGGQNENGEMGVISVKRTGLVVDGDIEKSARQILPRHSSCASRFPQR